MSKKRKTYTSPEVKDRWNREHYDDVRFRVPKGGREAIQTAAAARGMSVAAYIRHLILADNPGNADVWEKIGGGGVMADYLKQPFEDIMQGLLDDQISGQLLL